MLDKSERERERKRAKELRRRRCALVFDELDNQIVFIYILGEEKVYVPSKALISVVMKSLH